MEVKDESPKVRINDAETEILRGLSSRVPRAGIIVEVGSAWGHSTVNMAEACLPDVKIYAIDSWGLIEKWAYNEDEFIKNTKRFGDKIVRIKSFSQNVKLDEYLAGQEVDLLFIDGDHHENAVRDDYLLYSPYVRQGGVIVFHDYGLLAGVTKAVTKYVETSGLWTGSVQERFWIGEKI